MKNVKAYVLAGFVLLALCPTKLISAPMSDPTPLSTVAKDDPNKPVAEALLARLDEIKAMDKSSLKPSERRELRKETRSIRHELRQLSGGVYLSAGAVILILVLLIIFL